MIIKTRKGEEIIVSEIDFNALSEYTWHIDSRGYPVAHIYGRDIVMHNFLIGKPNKSFVTDHINRNKLDNRRENLRLVTKRINRLNSLSMDKAVGVVKDNGNSWRAYIEVNGNKMSRNFSSKEEAIEQRKKWVEEFGHRSI